MASDSPVCEVIPWFERAEREPARPFVVGPRTLTYGQLGDQVRRLSTLFRQLELRRDDRAVIATTTILRRSAVAVFLKIVKKDR